MNRWILTALVVAAPSLALAAEAQGGSGMPAFLTDPKWFILYGIAAFLFLVYRGGGFKAITQGLDDRATKIASELKEAEALRAQAASLLAEYKAKQSAAEAEAKAIVAQAKTDADALRAQAQKDLEADLKRREALTAERIKRAEAQAQADVRAAAVDAAIAAAEKMLRAELTAERQGALIAAGVKDLAGKLG